MKTAVDWLVNEANKRQCWADENKMHYLITEAKELEKQQIVDAHLTGLIYPLEMDATKQAEQYYTETYK